MTRLAVGFVAGAVVVAIAWGLWAGVLNDGGVSDETKRNEAQVAQIVNDYLSSSGQGSWYAYSVEPYIGRWLVQTKNANTGRSYCAVVKRAPIGVKHNNPFGAAGCQNVGN